MSKEEQIIEKICLNCENSFTICSKYKRKLASRFCSTYCARSFNGKLNKGKTHSIEWKEALSIRNSGINNPFYGMKHTEENKKKIGSANKHPSPNKGRKYPQLSGDNNPSKRPEVRALISKRVRETHWDVKLDKNPNWKGGSSFLPYSPYRHLKDKIVERDKSSNCLICGGVSSRGYTNIHHIDYNKLNNDISNLCIVCPRCNAKANKNRQFWEEFITNKINGNGGIII